jgi:cAMP-dependent protein kinase regulator
MNQAQQQYIEKKLSPILEKLVECVLEEMPEELWEYMGAYFHKGPRAEKFAQEQTHQLLEELETSKKKVASLTQYCAELEKVIIQIAPSESMLQGGSTSIDEAAAHMVQDAKADEEEEEESDQEPPPDFTSFATRGPNARASVSAEAIGEWNQKKEFIPVKHGKDPAEKDKLQSVLRKSFLFAGLSEDDMGTTIDAMKKTVAKQGESLISQGDSSADCMYVVSSGDLQCFVNTSAGEKHVKTVHPGEVVGELALLYNCPRAATVRPSDGDVELWELDRDTFNAIVKDSAARTRDRSVALLEKVSLMSVLDAADRSKIADSLFPETYQEGEYIIRVGDAGDRMFFMEEGVCVAYRKMKSGSGESEEVMTYRAGDFFGELAIIRNVVRQADVIAKSTCKVRALQAADFRRLCGSLEERMEANASKAYRGGVW